MCNIVSKNCVGIVSTQAKLPPRRMNTAPSVSFSRLVLILSPLLHQPFSPLLPLLQPTTAARSVRRGSPTAPRQQTTTTDTWVRTRARARGARPSAVTLQSASTAPGCSRDPSLVLCVSLFIRTGAFQTSANPQSPSPHSHPHW